jgi:hypothetical protein
MVPASSEDRGSKIGPYRVVTAHQELTAEPTAYVLDTNVVIDMERFFFGHPSMRLAPGEPSQARREDLHRLLAEFAVRLHGSSVDLRYGFAVCEVGVKRDGSVNLSAYRPAFHAARTMVEWTESQIDRAFSNRHAPLSRDRTYLASRPHPPVPHTAVMGLIGPSYGALLKASDLSKPGSRRDIQPARRRIEEFLDWMMDTLGVCLPYETRVAVAMMAGTPEAERRARKLLKFSGSGDPDEMADNAWNAAWDLWFLRESEGHTFGMLRPHHDGAGEVTALVTRNYDPLWLREAGSIRATIDDGTQLHVLTEVQFDVRGGAIGEEIGELLDDKLGRARSAARMLRDPDEVSRVALEVVSDLERQIGVTVLTGSRD